MKDWLELNNSSPGVKWAVDANKFAHRTAERQLIKMSAHFNKLNNVLW